MANFGCSELFIWQKILLKKEVNLWPQGIQLAGLTANDKLKLSDKSKNSKKNVSITTSFATSQ